MIVINFIGTSFGDETFFYGKFFRFIIDVYNLFVGEKKIFIKIQFANYKSKRKASSL